MTQGIGTWRERAGVAAMRALDRFARLGPAGIARDLARARRLKRDDPPARSGLARPERIVVTLTTVPERLPLIAPVLRSLLDQTEPADAVVLFVPWHSRRTGLAYPDPLRFVPRGIEIMRCEDHGPATKVIPALAAYPDAHLVVADDDVIYPAGLVASLLAASRAHPGAAIGARGWTVEPGIDPRAYRHVFGTGIDACRPVDILLGTWGYLLPPGSLGAAPAAFEGQPDGMRWVDDVWIAGHLARRGVPRLVAPLRGLPLETRASRLAALTHGLNRDGANDRLAIASFADAWRGARP